MNEVRWGILGNATIGRKCVMPAITGSSNGRIIALGTRRPEQANQDAENNSIEKVYDSYDQVITDPEVDAVYVPLPNHLHLPWTLKALDAGKHVLCEKPLACTAEQALKMAAASKKSKCVLMEAMMYRFHPRSKRMREMVQGGSIGKPRLVRTAFCFSMAEKLLENGGNYRLAVDQGGGALLDVGCYGVSAARWLFGEEPVAVQGQAIFHDKHKVDIHVVASLRFASGALASIEASFCSGLQQTYTIVGSDGALELPHDAFIPWEKDALFNWRRRDEDCGETHTVQGIDEYRLMVEHFNHAVLTGAAPEVSLNDSIANLRVLDTLARAIRNDQCAIPVAL